jgi:hypothetical protein
VGAQHAQAFAGEAGLGDGPGLKEARTWRSSCTALRIPVDAGFGLFDLGCSWRPRGLGARPQRAGRSPSMLSINAAAPTSASASCRSPAVSCVPIERRRSERDRAGIQARVELHDR